MIVDSVPATVRALANDAKDLCVGACSYRVLVALLVGLFFGLPSLSAIVRSFTFVCSVSSLSEIEIRINRKLTYLDKKALVFVGEKGIMVYPSTSGVALTLKRNTAFSGGSPKQVAGGVVRLFGSSLRLKLAAVWNEDDALNEKPFACYVTNRTGLCLTRIWALSRFRWGIECYLRASKQDFCFDALPTESSDAAFGIVALGMFLYCNLELAQHDPDARPVGKTERKHPPLTSYIKMLRQESEERTYVRSLVMKPARDALLAHLRGGRDPCRSCLKPRDSARRQVEPAA